MRVNAWLILTTLLASSFSFAQKRAEEPMAKQETEIVKVGYYESANFQNGAKEGAVKSGYSYDYLQEISYYTGWKYEYVYGDWNTLLSSLQSGAIDLMAGVSYTEERAKTLIYQQEPMGHEYYYIYRPEGESSIKAGDYASYSGKVVGTIKNSLMSTMLLEWMDENSVDLTVKLYESFEDRDAALKAKEIDLLVNTDNNVFDDMELLPLDKVGESPYYLSSTKGKEALMEKVDEAVSEIISDSPNFVQNLQDKYFGNTSVSRSLSEEEKAWLSAHPTIKIGYLDNYLPYSDCGNDGKVTGLVNELLPKMFSEIAVERAPEFTYVSFASFRDMVSACKKGEIDIAFPVGGGAYYSELNGIFSTDSVLSASMSLVYTGQFSNEKTKVLAVNKNNDMQRYFTTRQYPNATILETDSVEACLQAVISGKATGTVINGLRVSAILSNAKYQSLNSAPLPDSDERCLGVAWGETALLGLLNHCLSMLSPGYASTVAYHYVSGLTGYSLADYLQQNIVAVSAIGVTIFLVIAGCLLMLFITSHNSAKKEKQGKEELALALDAAEAASRAKTSFLSNMSHDIRTPMNAIIGFTELAQTHLDEPEKTSAYLQKILKSSRHLLLLINDVLDMSRIESGKMNILSSPINLPTFMRDLEDIMSSDTAAKRLSFKVEAVDIKTENIIGDSLRLNQVFLNCLGNAVKFTPEGGTITLFYQEVPCQEENKAKYIFKVSDTGIGMSEEFLKHVFEPFTREATSTVSGIPGSGLGMAITKKIVTLLGGEISVESTLGKGTTMTIALTFEKGAAPKEATEKKAVPAKSLGSGRILLVEDNELNREIAMEMLSKAGLTADTAENGEIAVRKFKESEEGYYSLVLMDLQMPVMDGLEATMKIRALPRDDVKDVPIIALTANAFAEDMKRCKDAGMNEHVSKPLTFDKLSAVLARYIK